MRGAWVAPAIRDAKIHGIKTASPFLQPCSFASALVFGSVAKDERHISSNADNRLPAVLKRQRKNNGLVSQPGRYSILKLLLFMLRSFTSSISFDGKFNNHIANAQTFATIFQQNQAFCR